MQPIAKVIKLTTSAPASVSQNQSADNSRSVSSFFETFQCEDSDQTSALQSVIDWTRSAVTGKSAGLVLWSREYGCGKTHLAKCAHHALMWGGLPGTFLTAPDFLEIIRQTYSQNAIHNAIPQHEWGLFKQWASGYFILDDFGKQYSREVGWEGEKFFKLLDRMYERQAFLMTSNLPPEEMEQRLSGAAWDRLVGMCSKSGFVNMSSIPSYRLKKAGIQP